jgi:hypothetical protein
VTNITNVGPILLYDATESTHISQEEISTGTPETPNRRRLLNTNPDLDCATNDPTNATIESVERCAAAAVEQVAAGTANLKQARIVLKYASRQNSALIKSLQNTNGILDSKIRNANNFIATSRLRFQQESDRLKDQLTRLSLATNEMEHSWRDTVDYVKMKSALIDLEFERTLYVQRGMFLNDIDSLSFARRVRQLRTIGAKACNQNTLNVSGILESIKYRASGYIQNFYVRAVPTKVFDPVAGLEITRFRPMGALCHFTMVAALSDNIYKSENPMNNIENYLTLNFEPECYEWDYTLLALPLNGTSRLPPLGFSVKAGGSMDELTRHLPWTEIENRTAGSIDGTFQVAQRHRTSYEKVQLQHEFKLFAEKARRDNTAMVTTTHMGLLNIHLVNHSGLPCQDRDSEPAWVKVTNTELYERAFNASMVSNVSWFQPAWDELISERRLGLCENYTVIALEQPNPPFDMRDAATTLHKKSVDYIETTHPISDLDPMIKEWLMSGRSIPMACIGESVNVSIYKEFGRPPDQTTYLYDLASSTQNTTLMPFSSNIQDFIDGRIMYGWSPLPMNNTDVQKIESNIIQIRGSQFTPIISTRLNTSLLVPLNTEQMSKWNDYRLPEIVASLYQFSINFSSGSNYSHTIEHMVNNFVARDKELALKIEKTSSDTASRIKSVEASLTKVDSLLEKAKAAFTRATDMVQTARDMLEKLKADFLNRYCAAIGSFTDIIPSIDSECQKFDFSLEGLWTGVKDAVSSVFTFWTPDSGESPGFLVCTFQTIRYYFVLAALVIVGLIALQIITAVFELHLDKVVLAPFRVLGWFLAPKQKYT